MTIDTIADRYILDPEPPRIGGTARVHRARDHAAGSAVVAVKLYDGRALSDELLHECFLREKAALGALSNPHVVRMLAAGYDDQRCQHYVVMPWLQDDLLAHLQHQFPAGIQWSELAELVLRPLLLGLGAAHSRRIIHRDIKPSNLMVDSEATIKLTDFGIAKLLGSARQGMTVSALHSRPYAAPERDRGEQDARSDLYAVGVTMIDLLTDLHHRLPADTDPQLALAALQLPDDAAEFLETLVAREPDSRPHNARHALTELDRRLRWEQLPDPGPRRQFAIAITRAAVRQARGALSTSTDTSAEQAVRADLTCAAPSLLEAREDRVFEQESKVPLLLIGSELLYQARWARTGSGTLSITGASHVPSHVLDRFRDRGLPLEYRLAFAGEVVGQRELADAVIVELAERTSADRARQLQDGRSAVFDRWHSLLEAKSELEAQREDPIPYSSAYAEGRLITFSVDGTESELSSTCTRPDW